MSESGQPVGDRVVAARLPDLQRHRPEPAEIAVGAIEPEER